MVYHRIMMIEPWTQVDKVALAPNHIKCRLNAPMEVLSIVTCHFYLGIIKIQSIFISPRLGGWKRWSTLECGPNHRYLPGEASRLSETRTLTANLQKMAPASTSSEAINAQSRLSSIKAHMDGFNSTVFHPDNVPQAPEDPLFGLMAAYRKDDFNKKVDLGIGAYRDNSAKPWVLPVVKQVWSKCKKEGDIFENANYVIRRMSYYEKTQTSTTNTFQ